MSRFIDEKIRVLVELAEEQYLNSFTLDGVEIGVIPCTKMTERTIRKILQYLNTDGYETGVYELGEIVSDEEETVEAEIPLFSPEELLKEVAKGDEFIIDRIRYYFDNTYGEWKWDYYDYTYIVNKPRTFDLGDRMILFSIGAEKLFTF